MNFLGSEASYGLEDQVLVDYDLYPMFKNCALPWDQMHGYPMLPDGNIAVEDPYFVDPDNADWRARDYGLHRFSPCLERGLDAELVDDAKDADDDGEFDTLPDVARTNRVQPGLGYNFEVKHSDIGAFEHACPDPKACRMDGNGDGIVDAADLAIVLGSWSTEDDPSLPGDQSVPCLWEHDNLGIDCHFADLNFDYHVNAADLAMLLGAWGPCPDCPSNNSMAMASMGGPGEEGITPTSLAAAFGFESPEEFAEWLGTLSETARAVALAPLTGGGS